MKRGKKSRFQTWAPYRVQCPCLQRQNQPRWILLNFPSVDMGTLSKMVRFSLYPCHWVAGSARILTKNQHSQFEKWHGQFFFRLCSTRRSPFLVAWHCMAGTTRCVELDGDRVDAGLEFCGILPPGESRRSLFASILLESFGATF